MHICRHVHFIRRCRHPWRSHCSHQHIHFQHEERDYYYVAMRLSFLTRVSTWLLSEGFRSRHCIVGDSRPLLLVRGSHSSIALHLLPTPLSDEDVLPASVSAALADSFVTRKQTLVHLWEDQWEEHPRIVRSRLLAKLGRSKRLMGRQTAAQRIDSATADAFLLQNHLWGSTKARYRYGLFRQDELVAVASFSSRWNVRRPEGGPPRASHELIRYCSRRGETVVGGISKLIAAFRRDAKPDELVTVIDRDWGEGGGWSTLGFRPLRKLPPVTFYVGPDGRRCHPGSGPNPHRRRLPADIATAVQEMASEEDATRFLSTRGFFPVRDAGAERHLLILNPLSEKEVATR